mmetsp:Transcript_26564/g.40557  ORF Transcript_26564/g.40557 Transcript_26564/m.40557 type:complete len:89 (+) Transcript_26564:92-358(+)
MLQQQPAATQVQAPPAQPKITGDNNYGFMAIGKTGYDNLQLYKDFKNGKDVMGELGITNLFMPNPADYPDNSFTNLYMPNPANYPGGF